MFNAETVRDGVNLHEESESEQESQPYGGDNSTAIDHSVGSGRRRVGFLLGFSLSPSLAAAKRLTHNIGEVYAPEKSLGTADQK